MPSFGSEFLARFSAILTGKEQTIAGLKQLNAAADKQILTGQKITTMYDAQGNVTGKTIQDTIKIGQETKKASGYFNEMGKALGRVAVVVPVWMLARTVITGTLNAISQAGKFLVEMEDAMARIQIVGKGTTSELKSLQQGLIALAFAYGTSASEALNAAKIFAQQGRTVNETYQLTRAAMIGAKILGVSITDSVNNLTAAVEGFQIPINNAISIVDKWIAVEKEFAVTSQDLAEATKATAATANQMGVSMSQFLGQVTAVVEVTRKSGSEAARGLSFMYVRLFTTAKPVIEQITKIPFYLNAQGNATSEVTSKTRELTDILTDLAGKWESLTKEEKMQIATSLGSKRQMTTVNALMQNYSRSLDATIVSLTSAGQAQKAFLILQTTAVYKSQQLTAAWNTLTTTVADTGAWKGFLDILTKTVIGWAGLFNYAKGLRAIVAQQNADIISGIEARKSEIASLQDLLEIRDKLMKAPSTEKNTERIGIIQTAIEKLTATNPKIKIALDSGNIEELRRQIQKTTDGLEKERIIYTVQMDFFGDISDLEAKKRKLEEDIKHFTRVGLGESTEVINGKKELAIIDKEIIEKNARQTQEVEKQVALTKAQAIQKQMILETDEDIEEVSASLTDKEKEQIDNQLKLNVAKLSGRLNSEQLLALEIEQVKNSKFIYDAHEKNLKLAELEAAKKAESISTTNDLLDHELDLLKIRGASTLEIKKAELAIKVALSTEKDVNTSLKDRWELEKLILQEKLNQNKLSSDSIKLYRIAKTEGTQTAKILSDFLKGDIDLSQLREMPRIFEVAKREFADMIEQAQASEFFGVGRKSLGGGQYRGAPGFDVGIPELTPVDYTDLLAKMKQQTGTVPAIPTIAQTNNIPINIDIKNINVTAAIDKLFEEVKQRIILELDNKETEVSQKIQEKILGE